MQLVLVVLMLKLLFVLHLSSICFVLKLAGTAVLIRSKLCGIYVDRVSSEIVYPTFISR